MKKYEFLHHYYNGHRPHGYPLLEFVMNVYILDGYKFTKSKHPGVWRQGRKHIKNKDFFFYYDPRWIVFPASSLITLGNF